MVGDAVYQYPGDITTIGKISDGIPFLLPTFSYFIEILLKI